MRSNKSEEKNEISGPEFINYLREVLDLEPLQRFDLRQQSEKRRENREHEFLVKGNSL